VSSTRPVEALQYVNEWPSLGTSLSMVWPTLPDVLVAGYRSPVALRLPLSLLRLRLVGV
jgi:hypothetical protein